MFRSAYKKTLDPVKPAPEQINELMTKLTAAKADDRRYNVTVIVSAAVAAAAVIAIAAIPYTGIFTTVPSVTESTEESAFSNVGPETSSTAVESSVSEAESPHSSTSSPTTTHQSDANRLVPVWYLPGRLSTRGVLTRSVKSVNGIATIGENDVTPLGLSASLLKNMFVTSVNEADAVRLPETVVPNYSAAVNGDYVPLLSAEGHENESELFYDLKNEKVLCFEEAVGAYLYEHGKISDDSEYQLFWTDPVSGNCVTEVRSEGQLLTVYLYNVYTEELKWFPLDTRAWVVFSPDGTFAAGEMKDSDGKYRMFLTDLTAEELTATRISYMEDTWFSRPQFSESGNFVYFETVMCPETEEDFELTVYNIRERTQFRLNGHIVRFVEEDALIVAHCNGQGRVVNAVNGQEVDAAGLENWQKYRVQKTWDEARDVYSLELIPLSENGTVKSVVSDADAVLVTDRFLYWYFEGDDHITCYGLESEERFMVKLNADFVREIQKQQKEYELSFVVCPNGDLTKLTLMYFGEKKN